MNEFHPFESAMLQTKNPALPSPISGVGRPVLMRRCLTEVGTTSPTVKSEKIAFCDDHRDPLVEPSRVKWRNLGILASGLIICCLLTSRAIASPLFQDNLPAIPQEAEQINSTAAGLHNSGEYELAAQKWQELLQKFPETPLSNKARYYLGVCQYSLQDFQAAAETFRETIDKASGDSTFNNMPDAYLLYGYSQFSLAKAQQVQDEEQAARLIADAIGAYDTLLEKFPEHKLVQDAYYFKGEALYLGGNLDQAIAAYQTLVDGFPQGSFYQQALFYLGETQFESGDFQSASESGKRFLSEFADGSFVDQVRMRIPSAGIQLALAAANAGEAESAGELFKSAETELAALAADESFAARDDALFKQAFCILHQQRIEEAAQTYARLAESFPESARAAEAAISAGRFFFKANNYALAKQWLGHVERAENQYFLEANHWLCRIGLLEGEFAETLERAVAALKQATGSPLEISLMLDAGDALFEIAERRGEAAAFYQQAAEKFPTHELAPQALYNAAFTQMNVGNFDQAKQLAETFAQKYTTHEFYPDVREITAEIHMKQNDLLNAQQTFEEIAARFHDHPNRDRWNNRVGWVRFLQQDYDEVIAWLRPLVTDFRNPSDQAEALFRIASSQFQLQQFEKSKEACQESLVADKNWNQVDQVYLLLGRSEHALGNLDGALEVLKKLISDRPNSALMSETNYRIAEIYYEQQEFTLAREQYQKVIDLNESEFMPYALYGIAWLEMKQEQFDDAIRSFDRIVSDYSGHALENDALLGRGMSHRLKGNLEAAIEDLDLVSKASVSDDQKLSAMYERGLAEVGLARWEAAIDTFSTLIEKAPQSALTDRYLYELAWAQHEHGSETESANNFAQLAQQFPASPLAAESHFRAALFAYQNKDYSQAIEGFEACKTLTTSESLKEKAMFRLAWSHFHLGQFNESHDGFKAQVDAFPQGELAVDALTMIGESLHKSNQHALAVTAYRVAIPELAKSTTATPGMELLSRLHGAQSANLAHDYTVALEFAAPIIEQKPEWEFLPETWFEIGLAHHGLGENEQAIEAWERVVGTFNATGARARFMLGETLFGQKKFDEAVQQFKLVIFGYGGDLATDQVKKWQANSAYEAARCNFVRISTTTDAALKQSLIDEATKMFQMVVDKYPDSSFVEDSRKNLNTLESLK